MLDALVVVVVEVAASIAIIGVMLPAPSSIPLLAVTIPIESTFVTSSYVNVPPTDTLPVNVADDPLIAPVNVESPATLKSVSLSNCNIVLLNLADIFWEPALICANSMIPSSVPLLASDILPVIFA